VFAELRPAIIMFVLLTLLTGVIYPLAITGITQTVFPTQANGSLLLDDAGTTIGSSLIGQAFDQPQYFWGRPSAAGNNAAASGGSNLGPANQALLDAIKARVEALRAADPDNRAAPIPVDLVTASGSGLDPEISIAAARYQVPRVARERGLTADALESLISKYESSRDLGIFGEPRVNVLLLNIALDKLAQFKPAATAP
jgi:K+-transporting ATPase ATPase C chain